MKVITITDRVYEMLRAVKDECGLSFSETILKLVEEFRKRRDFSRYIGMLSEEEGKNAPSEIKKLREAMAEAMENDSSG